ncbi:MAG TPA: hypothetical protein VFL42_08175, partial [Terriglobales bacterium]|nr:hypothetical protein [Terriglobales bacterium]
HNPCLGEMLPRLTNDFEAFKQAISLVGAYNRYIRFETRDCRKRLARSYGRLDYVYIFEPAKGLGQQLCGHLTCVAYHD